MVFESFINNILEKILGKYIEGFEEKNLNIGIWKGNLF